MMQIPIILCIPYLDDSGATVLQWCEPIAPPRRNAVASDYEITDRLLDEIEVAVGARPTQYVMSIGGSRRWNPRSHTWEPNSPTPAE